MNELQVIGIEKVNYTNKNGYLVSGNRFHCIFTNSKILGSGTDVLYLSDSFLNKMSAVPQIDDYIEVLYDKFGRVSLVNVK